MAQETDHGKVQKRAVARRACLSCREKKIRCDGEKQRNESGQPVCTNCQFFGIDCVFVQSMRGGFRRKRISSTESAGFAVENPQPTSSTSSSPHIVTFDSNKLPSPTDHSPNSQQQTYHNPNGPNGQNPNGQNSNSQNPNGQNPTIPSIPNVQNPPNINAPGSHSTVASPLNFNSHSSSFSNPSGYNPVYANSGPGYTTPGGHSTGGHSTGALSTPGTHSTLASSAYLPKTSPEHKHETPRTDQDPESGNYRYRSLPVYGAYGHPRANASMPHLLHSAPAPYPGSGYFNGPEPGFPPLIQHPPHYGPPGLGPEHMGQPVSYSVHSAQTLPLRAEFLHSEHGLRSGPPSGLDDTSPSRFHHIDGSRHMPLRGITASSIGTYSPDMPDAGFQRDEKDGMHRNNSKDSIQKDHRDGAPREKDQRDEFYREREHREVHSRESLPNDVLRKESREALSKDGPQREKEEPRHEPFPRQNHTIIRKESIKNQPCKSDDYKTYRRASRGGSYFKFAELDKYDLPSDDVLTDVIDYFYDYQYVNCTFLPLKSYLLKWFSVTSETALYHAIIASVCSKRLWPFERQEYYWLDMMYKYWDDLNDFGMLVCYSLVCRIPYVAGNPDIFFDIKNKAQEIIVNNNYIEAVNKRTNNSTRKIYENEAIVRMLWLSWLESSFLRMRGSQPYTVSKELSSKGDVTGLDFMTLSSKLPLPLSNESFNNMNDSDRLSWEDFRANKHTDSSSVIKASFTLSMVLERLASNELFEGTYDHDAKFEQMIDDRRYEVRDSKLYLSSSISLSQQIYRYSRLLQDLHFTKKIFIFEFLAGSNTDHESEFGEAEIHWVNSMTCSKMMDVEELLTNVKEVGQFQWRCLLDLVENTAKLVELFELFLGILPGETVSKFPVICGPEISTTKVADPINEGQATTGEESWLKMSDFAIFCGSLLMVVVPSLVVLRKLISVEKVDGKSQIVNRKDPLASRMLDFDVPDELIAKFQPEVLNRWYERIVQYLRFRIKYEGSRQVKFQTQTNVDKLGHYMEEIVRNI